MPNYPQYKEDPKYPGVKIQICRPAKKHTPRQPQCHKCGKVWLKDSWCDDCKEEFRRAAGGG